MDAQPIALAPTSTGAICDGAHLVADLGLFLLSPSCSDGRRCLPRWAPRLARAGDRRTPRFSRPVVGSVLQRSLWLSTRGLGPLPSPFAIRGRPAVIGEVVRRWRSSPRSVAFALALARVDRPLPTIERPSNALGQVAGAAIALMSGIFLVSYVLEIGPEGFLDVTVVPSSGSSSRRDRRRDPALPPVRYRSPHQPYAVVGDRDGRSRDDLRAAVVGLQGALEA